MRRVLVLEIDSGASTSRFLGRTRLPSDALVGGKGRSLAALAAHGFEIPRTLVFTTRLFQAHAPDLEAIRRALAAGERPSQRSVARARRAVLRRMDRALAAPVREALERLRERSRSGLLAVRSSAVGEDRAATTFAGLHDSFLGLEGVDAALDSLQACWASLLSDRALDYRRRRRLRAPLAMAVVAQEHVASVVAGVAFSSVGWGERARLVVELAPPGESAPVTGARTPERFEVRRAPQGGASRADVRAAASGILPGDVAIDVARLALECEGLLAGPADVEWLLRPGGEEPRVVLVQARPARTPPPPRFDRTAVAESLPDAVAPLARDFLHRAYGRAFARYHQASEVLASRVLVYRGGRFFLDTWRHAALPGRAHDARDGRWRLATARTLRTSERALARMKLSGRVAWRTALRELDRLLPLYLLAQDDVILIQETILGTRARLELPLGAPAALEAGRDFAFALARARPDLARGRLGTSAVRALVRRFGHRGGCELDLASPSLRENVRTIPVHAASRMRAARQGRKQHPAIEGLLEHGREAALRSDRLRDRVTLAVRRARAVALALGASQFARGDDVFFVSLEELERLLGGESVRGLGPKIAARRRALERDRAKNPPLASNDPEHEATAPLEPGAAVLLGVAASAGSARGPVRVVRTPRDMAALRPGEILVAHAATADLFGSLMGAAGLVTDVGGMLSHGAILARELGIPAVVATGTASSRLRTGAIVAVDGERGTVTLA